jgi:hypothetical protein
MTALPQEHMLSHMKRTTLVLDSALYHELKKRAAQEGRTLTEVIERTLRLGLAATSPPRRVKVALPSYELGPFLVDPRDREGLEETLRERGRRERP